MWYDPLLSGNEGVHSKVFDTYVSIPGWQASTAAARAALKMDNLASHGLVVGQRMPFGSMSTNTPRFRLVSELLWYSPFKPIYQNLVARPCRRFCDPTKS